MTGAPIPALKVLFLKGEKDLVGALNFFSSRGCSPPPVLHPQRNTIQSNVPMLWAPGGGLWWRSYKIWILVISAALRNYMLMLALCLPFRWIHFTYFYDTAISSLALLPVSQCLYSFSLRKGLSFCWLYIWLPQVLISWWIQEKFSFVIYSVLLLLGIFF